MSQVSGGYTTTGSSSATSTEGPSIGELFSHVTEDLSTLMRQEVALAKAEATQSAKKAGKGAGMLAGAGVAGFFVLMFLSVAAWWGLGTAIGNRGWSGVIVAVVCSASVTARAATWAASLALWLISRIDAPICSAPAATVATLRLTSSAAAATTPDCAEVSSAEAEI